VHSGGPVLTSDQSAILRDRLLGQLVAIDSTDEAAAWARRNLSTKNTQTCQFKIKRVGTTMRAPM